MSSTTAPADVKKPDVVEPAGGDKDKEKERNAEIVRRATAAFLEYRRALSTVISPELGVIDDLTVTWMARYGNEKKGDPLKKFGRMHVSLHTKTAPEGETGRQVFNSFTIDSNVSFEHDLHPVIEEQEEKKRKEDEEKKQQQPEKSEKIEEIVSAAAASAPAP